MRSTSGAIRRPLLSRKTRIALRHLVFLDARPLLLDPSCHLLVIPFERTPLWFLWAPSHRMQQPPDMIDMVASPILVGNELGNPWAGPQVAKIPRSFRAFQQSLLQIALLLFTQLRGAHRRRFRAYPLCSLCAEGCFHLRMLRHVVPMTCAISMVWFPLCESEMAFLRRFSDSSGLP